jgi:NADPH:quinone reductase-like Zn-dependent oxidoreductase
MPSTLRDGRLAGGRRYRLRGLVRLRGLATIGIFVATTYLIPGKRRTTPYSIQWLKRLRPAWYREDLIALFELLRQGNIEPIVAERIPLEEVARAHELLGNGSVMGKIVLLCDTGKGE